MTETLKNKFALMTPEDGYTRVMDEILDVIDNSIETVVSGMDLSVFGNMDKASIIRSLTPMFTSLQNSLLDILSPLKYDRATVPKDWIRHLYDGKAVPSDAVGHFAAVGDIRGAMELLAERIKQQASYTDMQDMEPQKRAAMKLSIEFITGMIDQVLTTVNALDDKNGFEAMKRKYSGQNTSLATARRIQPRMPKI